MIARSNCSRIPTRRSMSSTRSSATGVIVGVIDGTGVAVAVGVLVAVGVAVTGEVGVMVGVNASL